MQMSNHPITLDPASCYSVLAARDARFDGLLFVGVTTTRIYCRPVCGAQLPGPDRCRYFSSAPEAEARGYRPCLRCHPERAPGLAAVDAVSRVAAAAADRISAGELNGSTVEQLAESLHIGPRQLRRSVRRIYGVTPVQLAQTHRLLMAKRLLSETGLSITEIAFASGFSSIRRFNAVFRERYRLSPSDLRRGVRPLDSGMLEMGLDYRPPFDWPRLLGFLAGRAIPGVEVVNGEQYARTVALRGHYGWIVAKPRIRPPNGISVSITLSLVPVLMPLLARLRHLFDLDASPCIVVDHLASDSLLSAEVRANSGVRVPGAMDGFEVALRAILGQQVTVKAATALSGRLTQTLSAQADTAVPGLTLYPPTAEQVVAAGPEKIAGLGVPRSRAECLVALARACIEDGVQLDPGCDVEETLARLQRLPGIGPWTAQYIAMRALHWPDAFPDGDLALRKSLGNVSPTVLREAAERWRPWRAYAAMHLWHRPAATQLWDPVAAARPVS